MKKFIKENMSWKRITILTLVLAGAAISLHLYSKDEKNTGNIIWRVSYINTNLKKQDYIHSTTENGCRCSYMPYEFGSDFYELHLDSVIDSTSAINRFYDFKDEETYVVYQAYPYCKVEDWGAPEDWADRKLITARGHLIDTWAMCLKFGLIDSAGHYTHNIIQP
jgi:hypothetical protein